MSHALTLTGYRFSVYTRAVRMALAAKGVAHGYAECDPFDAGESARLAELHPFGKVPVLDHGGVRIWETRAILVYVDEAFGAPGLMPGGALDRARQHQVMGIVDAYLYWPLVARAFSNGVFQPLMGEAADPREVEAGLAQAPRVLDALEEIATEGRALVAGELTLADCLLWPMLDYFAMLAEGRRIIDARPALGRWADAMARSEAARATRPALPQTCTGEDA